LDPPPKIKAEPHRGHHVADEAPVKSTGQSLAAAKEKQIKASIESYQLEAGFDPEGAAKKLRQLKSTIPANARVQRDIDKALKGIGL
jgi:hypothetical protein